MWAKLSTLLFSYSDFTLFKHGICKNIQSIKRIKYYKNMISPQQSMKACILSIFLTRKGLPIRVFQYSETDKLIRIEAGFRNRQVKLEINDYGRYRYV